MRKQNSLSSLNTLDDRVRNSEFGMEPGPIELKLGAHQVSFENGEWITGTSVLYYSSLTKCVIFTIYSTSDVAMYSNLILLKILVQCIHRAQSV